MRKKSEPLPPHLVLTPERKVKIAEEQAKLRAEAMSRGRLSPEARRMQIAAAHETSARADVEMLSEELRENRRDKEKIARLMHARSRLAEALALQGRYHEAAEVEPDKDKRAHYEMMWSAVWRVDTEECECQPGEHEEIDTHDFIAEEVISQKHGNALMPAIKCNSCGFQNVKPLTHELQQQQRARSQVAAVLHGYDAKHLKHNAAAMLTSEGLHDGKLLRK